MKVSIENIKYHLEWRQSNIPGPVLSDGVLYLLNKGLMYIHGRCMDQSPIVILNLKKLSDHLKLKKINPHLFCQLHHFIANYIKLNMLVPGQVEKWITITDIA